MEAKNLITVLGWEERFIAGFDKILDSEELDSIILIIFNDYAGMSKMDIHKTDVEDKAKKKNIPLETIELNYNNSIDNWKTLNTFFKEREITDVLANLTTIPRETIWALLFFLKKNNTEVKYIYFKPIEYSKGWLTKNHKEPRLLFKHSGIFDLDKELLLIVLTGFDETRLIQLVEYYEPQKLIILNQDGSEFENSKRNKSLINLNTELVTEVQKIDSYLVDDTTKVLDSCIENNSKYNIILASQGPKTSSLSSYNAYLNSNKKIGLSYVPARDFSPSYSTGINEKEISGNLFF